MKKMKPKMKGAMKKGAKMMKDDMPAKSDRKGMMKRLADKPL